MFYYLFILAVLTAYSLFVLYKNYRKKNRISDRDKLIIRLRKNGYSIRLIAEFVDIQKSQVHNICKKHGL